MATATQTRKTTAKQRERLDGLPDEVRVVGWDEDLRGPVIRFVTGTLMVITRDGGLNRP